MLGWYQHARSASSALESFKECYALPTGHKLKDHILTCRWSNHFDTIRTRTLLVARIVENPPPDRSFYL